MTRNILLRALLAWCLLVPLTASAGDVVTHTYGFGNINEPKCLGGVDGDDCQVLVPEPAGCADPTPNGFCASRGPGVQVSSGAHTQSDPTLPLQTYFGTIVIEENTLDGTVAIPAGSRSGFALQGILNLDLGFDKRNFSSVATFLYTNDV